MGACGLPWKKGEKKMENKRIFVGKEIQETEDGRLAVVSKYVKPSEYTAMGDYCKVDNGFEDNITVIKSLLNQASASLDKLIEGTNVKTVDKFEIIIKEKSIGWKATFKIN